MSTLTDHNRWLSGCRHVSNKGTHLTPGDIVHCGLGDYVESMRCPNGLPVDTRNPDQVPAWRRRVEKARRDIEAGDRKWRIMDMAEEITDEQFEVWFSSMRDER